MSGASNRTGFIEHLTSFADGLQHLKCLVGWHDFQQVSPISPYESCSRCPHMRHRRHGWDHGTFSPCDCPQHVLERRIRKALR